jgi:hypothetical protein
MSECTRCDELLLAYGRAAEKLAPVSKELLNASTSYEADIFNRIWERLQVLIAACEESRHALRHHQLTHEE